MDTRGSGQRPPFDPGPRAPRDDRSDRRCVDRIDHASAVRSMQMVPRDRNHRHAAESG